jgi:hypothetical protein
VIIVVMCAAGRNSVSRARVRVGCKVTGSVGMNVTEGKSELHRQREQRKPSVHAVLLELHPQKLEQMRRLECVGIATSAAQDRASPRDLIGHAKRSKTEDAPEPPAQLSLNR